MYDKAEADYLKIIELDPNDKESYFQLGRFHGIHSDNDEKAITQFMKALEIDSTYFFALNGVGTLYYLNKNFVKAEEWLLKAAKVFKKERDGSDNSIYNTLGKLYFNLKKYEISIKYYSKGVELNPKNLNNYFDRAYTYYFLKIYDKAEVDYLKAIELNPNNLNAKINLGLLYLNNLNDPEKAISQYIKALEISSESSLIFNGLGRAYKQLKNYKKAGEYYLMATKIDTLDKAPFNNLGRLYYDQKIYKKSIEYYSKSIEIDTSQYIPYWNRADAYIASENYDKAEIDYLKVIELVPNKINLYYSLGQLYEKHLKEPEKAIAQYLKALEIDPNNLSFLVQMGLYYYKIDDYDKTEYYFLRASKFDTLHGTSFFNLSLLYSKYGEYQKSINSISKAIQISPKTIRFFRARAILYRYNLMDYQKALDDINMVIKLDPKNFFNYLTRADFHSRSLNDYDKALSDYNKAIDLDPKNAFNYAERASFFEKHLQNYDKALVDYTKSIDLDPENITILNRRGVFYNKKLKDYDKALADFNSAIKLNDKSDRSSYYYRASLYIDMNDFEKAIADCKLTITMDYMDPEGHYKLAMIYESQSMIIKSISNISISIYLFEGMKKGEYLINDDDMNRLDLSDLYLYRANLYSKINQKDSMCEDYNTAFSLTKELEKKDELELLILENCK